MTLYNFEPGAEVTDQVNRFVPSIVERTLLERLVYLSGPTLEELKSWSGSGVMFGGDAVRIYSVESCDILNDMFSVCGSQM